MIGFPASRKLEVVKENIQGDFTQMCFFNTSPADAVCQASRCTSVRTASCSSQKISGINTHKGHLKGSFDCLVLGGKNISDR